METVEITWASDALKLYGAEKVVQITMYSIVACFLVYVIKSLLLGLIFKKAGRRWWEAWIPVLRDWSFFKIGGYKGLNIFWGIGASFALCLIASLNSVGLIVPAFFASIVAFGLAIVYFVFRIASIISIQKKFGKPGVFILLYLINLIAPLWTWILALDNSKYNKKKGHK